MSENNTEIFFKRLAALLLIQKGILPKNTLGLKPKTKGPQPIVDILQTDAYWEKKLKDWRVKT